MESEAYKNLSQVETVICIAGNDGTGKSTILNYINRQLRNTRPQFYCIQRSFKDCPEQFKPLLQKLRQMDLITYNYAFQDQRIKFQISNSLSFKVKDESNIETFKKVRTYWFMLDLEPEKIRRRLHSRKIVDIHDSKKAVEYYSFIYQQFAWNYGIPLIYADLPTQKIVQSIVHQIQTSFCNQVYSMRFQAIDLNFLNQRNIQNQIATHLANAQSDLRKIYQLAVQSISNSQISSFFTKCTEFKNLFEENKQSSQEELKKFKVSLSARWLIINGAIQSKDKKVLIKYHNIKNSIDEIIELTNFSVEIPYLKIYQQGESKILYSIHSSIPEVELYYSNKVLIILKSTIYSHTKQHTGQIANLSQIRALGNIIFLEMMRRNNLIHAYLCINYQNGIILSRYVKTNQLQVIFKKQCLGTDKHSYHCVQDVPEIVDKQNCYSTGIYIRFDWRNPNHFLIKNPKLVLNLNPYYFVVQKYFGKEKFFTLFLTNDSIRPMGDKCISQDILSQYIPIRKIKKTALKVYSTFQYYSNKIGLSILDGCMMFDISGDTVWSQINPDCMRVKSIKDKQDYDKDIWRYGGSSKKEQIISKWSLFNKLFIQWFEKNRYHQTQMIELPELGYPYQQLCRKIISSNSNISSQYVSYYRELSSPRWDKQLIGTIDISEGKPILVKSSSITQTHSNGSLNEAYNKISLLHDIVLVDIDAALDIEKTGLKHNRNEIANLISKDINKIYAVGGGIRNQQVLNYYLNELKCSKIILSSNLDLLKLIKLHDVAQRIVVQLSINQNNEVLVKGRSQNTKVNVITKILQLIQFGVKTISLTFNHSEGHLLGIPRNQFVQIHSQIPHHIERIIVAGGITSLSDLNFIWGFKRCVPQLGSAIWKQKISIADIYSSIVRFNSEGLIVTIITDQNQKILGQIFMNQQALKLSCQTRKLYRYSREYQKILLKGQTSDNIFHILGFKLDCDNDSIIVQVVPIQKSQIIFCHQNQFSCFDSINRKNDLNTLQQHIFEKRNKGSGYSKKMMENEGLAAMKIIQQVQELQVSSENKVSEAADLIAHLIMYFNAHEIKMNEVLSELEKRSINEVKILKTEANSLMGQEIIDFKAKSMEEQSEILVGIIGGKHYQRLDKLAVKMLGVKIIRAINRSAKIDFEIVNQQFYQQRFGSSKIKLIGIKSKDMTVIAAKGLISFCFNYSIMMENYPTVCKEIIKMPTLGITLQLLGRKNQNVDPKKWTSKNKGIIVCEYPFSVNKYFKRLGIEEKCYTLIRVSGGTESYLVSEVSKAVYCDAIVQSGKTVEDNDLKMIATLEETIYASFYKTL